MKSTFKNAQTLAVGFINKGYLLPSIYKLNDVQ